MYFMIINNVNKVLDLVHDKGAFFQVGISLMLPYNAQNPLNMLHVLLPITREKLSMAKGKPQQTSMTAEINSIPTYAI
jgi:hypothetical protein